MVVQAADSVAPIAPRIASGTRISLTGLEIEGAPCFLAELASNATTDDATHSPLSLPADQASERSADR
jgi:hypothetical protein